MPRTGIEPVQDLQVRQRNPALPHDGGRDHLRAAHVRAVLLLAEVLSGGRDHRSGEGVSAPGGGSHRPFGQRAYTARPCTSGS